MDDEFFSLNLFGGESDESDSEGIPQNLLVDDSRSSFPVINNIAEAVEFLNQPVEREILSQIDYVVSTYMVRNINTYEFNASHDRNMQDSSLQCIHRAQWLNVECMERK